MTNANDKDGRIGELQALLDTYGADRSRWPAADRLRLAGFVAADSRARSLIEEAVAFDRLLDMAPVVCVERERALARRIVETAVAGRGAPYASSGRVIDFSERAGKTTPSAFAWRGSARHAAGALLAASLVFGIVAGMNSQVSSAFDALAQVAGLSDDEPELAFIGEASSTGEETL